jgi:Ran-binding protein 1
LFIFGETLLDKGTGKKSWRERGIGDIRILRHQEHHLLRLLMRQEKTMKVICNHAIDPRIELRPNAGNDRSWVWHAFDFASGTLEETMFAIRFADSDIANDFKKSFEQSQADMKELVGNLDEQEAAAAAEVTAAADAEAEKAVEETADTLAGLSTKEDAPAAEESS